MGKEIVGARDLMADDDQTGLPPAGDERREVLKKRTDTLEAKGEAMAAEQELYAANPEAYRPDNDIQAQIEFLGITNAHADRHYVWSQVGGSGRFVTAKRALGYQLINSGDDEARELMQPDGSRKVGDVILMWIPRERYRQLAQQAEYRRLAREKGVTAKALELADRYAGTGVKVYEGEGIPQHVLAKIDRQDRAKKHARSTQDKWLREGTMPGMPMSQG